MVHRNSQDNKSKLPEKEKEDYSIKELAVRSMIWNIFGNFSGTIIALVKNIFLARLLQPEDFGVISLSFIFVTISEMIVDSGFHSALIQKKNIKTIEYNTIFLVTIIIGIIISVIIFIGSSLIAEYYKDTRLVLILKCLSVVIIVRSFIIVPNTILEKNLNFKLLVKVSILSNLCAAIISIILAYLGFNYFSLIIYYITESLIRLIMTYIYSEWRPTLEFNILAFKPLFSFGYKLLLSSIISTVSTNLRSLIIAKKYSIIDLGYYNQAYQLQSTPVQVLSKAMSQVIFPLFSSIQYDNDKLTKSVKSANKLIGYIVFPSMVLLYINARDIIVFLFTVKWIETEFYLKMFCIAGMVNYLQMINLNVLKAKGESKYYLYIEIIKQSIGIIVLLLSSKYGIKSIMVSIVICEYFFIPINGIFSKKLINYRVIDQIKDIIPIYLFSWIAGYLSNLIVEASMNTIIIKLIIKTILYIVIYILFTKITKVSEFKELYMMFRNSLKKDKI